MALGQQLLTLVLAIGVLVGFVLGGVIIVNSTNSAIDDMDSIIMPSRPPAPPYSPPSPPTPPPPSPPPPTAPARRRLLPGVVETR